MKNIFFVIIFLVGCGEGGPSDEINDAGADSRAAASTDAMGSSRSDSLPSAVTPCVIPTPKFPNAMGTPGYPVTTTPRGGFRVVDGFMTCSTTTTMLPPPSNCSSPVDGYSDGKTSWCCVGTVLVSSSSKTGKRFGLSSPSPQCLAPGSIGIYVAAGNVAVCSSAGVFLGWDCMP
jgi:hypothetical protein